MQTQPYRPLSQHDIITQQPVDQHRTHHHQQQQQQQQQQDLQTNTASGCSCRPSCAVTPALNSAAKALLGAHIQQIKGLESTDRAKLLHLIQNLATMDSSGHMAAAAAAVPANLDLLVLNLPFPAVADAAEQQQQHSAADCAQGSPHEHDQHTTPRHPGDAHLLASAGCAPVGLHNSSDATAAVVAALPLTYTNVHANTAACASAMYQHIGAPAAVVDSSPQRNHPPSALNAVAKTTQLRLPTLLPPSEVYSAAASAAAAADHQQQWQQQAATPAGTSWLLDHNVSQLDRETVNTNDDCTSVGMTALLLPESQPLLQPAQQQQQQQQQQQPDLSDNIYQQIAQEFMDEMHMTQQSAMHEAQQSAMHVAQQSAMHVAQQSALQMSSMQCTAELPAMHALLGTAASAAMHDCCIDNNAPGNAFGDLSAANASNAAADQVDQEQLATREQLRQESALSTTIVAATPAVVSITAMDLDTPYAAAAEAHCSQAAVAVAAAAALEATGFDVSQEIGRYARVITCKTYLKRLNITQAMAEELLPLHKAPAKSHTLVTAAAAAAAAAYGSAVPTAQAYNRNDSNYELLFKDVITLIHESEDMKYKIQYEGVRCNNQRHLRFTSGWRDFVYRTGIQLGDTLMFERRGDNRHTLYVSILRAGSSLSTGDAAEKRRQQQQQQIVGSQDIPNKRRRITRRQAVQRLA